MPHYFNIKSGLYHYHSTALNTYRTYFKGETVKLKKYFYVLRPLLACKWILRDKTVPSVLFSELADTELDKKMKPVVDNLVSLKMQTSEIGENGHIIQLDEYIEQNLDRIKTEIDSLPSERKTDWDGLNKLFTKILQ